MMIDFLLQHQFWAAVVLYWIFSAAISALPEPGPKGSPGYVWLYRFLHTTAGNLTTAFSRLPGMKPFILLLLVPLVFSTTACGAQYRIHPGAVNATDSAAYDSLLIAEAAIKQAQADDPGDKDRINNLVRLYNVARESWLTYRSAITPDNLQQLNQNATDLMNAVQELAGKGVKQ
jgi:hypothetical protein